MTANEEIIQARERYKKKFAKAKKSWKEVVHEQHLIGTIGLEILHEFGFPAEGAMCGVIDNDPGLIGAANGWEDGGAEDKHRWDIWLARRWFRDRLTKRQRVSILVHEWAHLLLGHSGFPQVRPIPLHHGPWRAFFPLPFPTMAPWYEAEAEAIALLVTGFHTWDRYNDYRRRLQRAAKSLSTLDKWPMDYDFRPLAERMRKAVGKHYP